MQRLEVSGAVRPIYGSLGVKRLNRRLDGAHSRSGRSGEEKNLLPCRDSNPGLSSLELSLCTDCA